MHIIKADARQLDREQAEALARIENATWLEILPDDPETPVEEFIADFNSLASFQKAVVWLAEADGVIAGVATLHWTTRDENRERGRLSISVDPAHRRRGVGTKLMREVVEFAPEAGVSFLSGWVSPLSAAGPSFCARLGVSPEVSTFGGSKSDYQATSNRLYLDKVDRKLLEEWVARADERASEYRLEFWEGPTKEDDLPLLAKVVQSMNSAPRSDGEQDEHLSADEIREYELETVKAGWTLWTMAARHLPSGEFGGFTVIYPPRFRPVAYQEDTGVLPSHRNRGLGRWLKASMLLKLIESHPQTMFIETWNAPTNEPMLKINHELGFGPAVTLTKYGSPLADLSQRLQASKAHT